MQEYVTVSPAKSVTMESLAQDAANAKEALLIFQNVQNVRRKVIGGWIVGLVIVHQTMGSVILMTESAPVLLDMIQQRIQCARSARRGITLPGIQAQA